MSAFGAKRTSLRHAEIAFALSTRVRLVSTLWRLLDATRSVAISARSRPIDRLSPIRLGLGAAHEEAFLDDLTVMDRVKPDLIELHAFLALRRDL